MITCNAKDATVFDPWTADLPELARNRELCLEVIEYHGLTNAWHLTAPELRQIQYNKSVMEEAAKKLHGVRVWLV